MAEQKFIQYGDKKMPMGTLTLEQAKATMARFFPELADPKVETKKSKDEIVYVFTKQAGRKGAGARYSRHAARKRSVSGRTPLHRITKNLRALKATPVIPPAALAFAMGDTQHIGWQTDQFLLDESAATRHAVSELAALAPQMRGGVLL